MINREKICEIIKKVSPKEIENISGCSRIREDLCLNSLSMLLLIVQLEEELNKSLSPDIFINVETVDDLLGTLNEVNER